MGGGVELSPYKPPYVRKDNNAEHDHANDIEEEDSEKDEQAMEVDQ